MADQSGKLRDDTNAVQGPARSLLYALQGCDGGKPSFLNIGFNPLFGWGMLFDAVNQRIGFIPL